MAIDPVSAGLSGLGLIGSFFGSDEPELPPEVRQLLRQLQRAYRDTMSYAKGIPGSDPQEQAALAQARALAGNEQNNAYQSLLASYQPGSANASNTADALGRYQTAATNQMAGLDFNFLQQFLQNRQGLRYGGAQSLLGMGLGAAGGARMQQPESNYSGLLMQLGQMYGQNKAQGATFKPPTSGTQMNTPGSSRGTNYSDPYGIWNGGGILSTSGRF